jgi:hypothetical protein
VIVARHGAHDRCRKPRRRGQHVHGVAALGAARCRSISASSSVCVNGLAR